MPVPTAIDLQRDVGLTLTWPDGSRSFYPIALLRHLSPSADMRQLREQMRTNALAVLPAGARPGPVSAVDAQLVGNYAIRIRFSDGHSTGLYTWEYLAQIDPARAPARESAELRPEPGPRSDAGSRTGSDAPLEHG